MKFEDLRNIRCQWLEDPDLYRSRVGTDRWGSPELRRMAAEFRLG